MELAPAFKGHYSVSDGDYEAIYQPRSKLVTVKNMHGSMVSTRQADDESVGDTVDRALKALQIMEDVE